MIELKKQTLAISHAARVRVEFLMLDSSNSCLVADLAKAQQANINQIDIFL